ncbi:PREDICTED: lipid storage droplets surface-binding protein 2 [Dinoponera quadriceps]|uniref:Lipid storage droplets surface-binding protein 2 n=1 Tax=Dinoponera quadriceps TaxID=609295 RepID=A0A6P3Y503_DINQU|nr:PREDICTED: lipid storage droplets surface-binding protein 2 [Dinoponera quadriceps]
MTDASKTSSNSESAPRLEVIDRVKNIPVVHSAIEKTGSTYSYVKDSHHLVNWALSYAEAGLHYATATATPLAAPLAKKFEGPISAVDQKLCQGLDIVEQKVPIVKQPPQQIYDAAKAVMSSSLQPTIDKLNARRQSVSQQLDTLKEVAVVKANELLNTPCGNKAVEGVDNTSVLVNRLLDRYFPPVEGEESDEPSPVSAEENKVLHAVQTIGHLSKKTANRVYHSVAAQLKTVKKEDVQTYISSVVSILHLTHFLNNGQKPEDETKEQQSGGQTDNKEGKNK